MNFDFTTEIQYSASSFKIVSAELNTDGRMEVVKQYPSNASYCGIGGGLYLIEW